MIKASEHITVFEHETIRFDKGEKRITRELYEALQLYYGKGVPYFRLCYNGIQFCEYVGVIQVGKTVIEILPKADKNPNLGQDEQKWRDVLIGMLRVIGVFDIHSTSNSHLNIKSNTILDLYFELFLKEVEFLVHSGLVKQYRKKQGNLTALKGSLQFGKHIQHNLVHKENFYVSHNTYDVDHLLHFILYKTICLIKQINTNVSLQSRIGSLLLNFPEMPDVKVTESTFDKLVFNRKTQKYQNAVEIAKLLLLKYHPDISKGQNNVLALMFDMNVLWERFVYVSLRKVIGRENTITSQTTKSFWKPQNGNYSSIRPDIVINYDSEQCVVLDTKWKNLGGTKPSPDDLRQMYVYHEYFKAKKVALVYPSNMFNSIGGVFSRLNDKETFEKSCSVIGVGVGDNITIWQEEIAKYIKNWMDDKSNN
ncbi:5-methylcytosine-specific restriction enzyme subunit McrC [Arcicella aurantiaca]|uniref:5-methylcytosine-specific restriction enzyme subunit McrC n=1 Tax=Arcicella aurantiaca TaxID=591202 RepID=A0A316EBJ5_9BACT|nr:restriction endonuclease [Arcicella aurantiaca]PWK28217.1 5-methylcytosine-specific restriction enzyme subunit McrC [Arcicella aurantiaca]